MADVVIDRDMAITWEEFKRSLPAAIGSHPWEIGEREIRIALPRGDVSIILGPTGERCIASLVLPSTPVRIHYQGDDRAFFEQFLERFDTYMRRGGG